MDAERFAKLVNDPRRTKEELLQMRSNAIAAGQPEFARLAEEILHHRYSGWNVARSKRSGATPTTVSFKSDERSFQSAKEAYVWLIERFLRFHPEPFLNLNWETAFIAKGQKRNYFGRDPKTMFHESPHLAADLNNWTRLSNGWVVNLNLSNAQKLDILMKFAAVAKLSLQDWRWHVQGGYDTDESRDFQI